MPNSSFTASTLVCERDVPALKAQRSLARATITRRSKANMDYSICQWQGPIGMRELTGSAMRMN